MASAAPDLFHSNLEDEWNPTRTLLTSRAIPAQRGCYYYCANPNASGWTHDDLTKSCCGPNTHGTLARDEPPLVSPNSRQYEVFA